MFISFFVAFGFALGLANGAPIPTGNSDECLCQVINKNIDNAQNTALDQQSNNKLALENMRTFLKAFVTPLLAGNLYVYLIVSKHLVALKDALNGGSKRLTDGDLVDAFIYILVEMAKNGVTVYKTAAAKSIANALEGSDPEKNAKINKDTDEALKLAVAKRDAKNMNRTDGEAALNDLNDLVTLFLRFVSGFSTYAYTPILYGVRGLADGLLNGGVPDGVGGAAAGLAKGATIGDAGFLKKALILSKQ